MPNEIKPTNETNELTQNVRDLFASVSDQLSLNNKILADLKRSAESGERTSVNQISATFVEYRKTLHERFGIIHEQIGHIDLSVESLVANVNDLRRKVDGWRTMSRVGLACFFLAILVTNGFLLYGALLLRG